MYLLLKKSLAKGVVLASAGLLFLMASGSDAWALERIWVGDTSIDWFNNANWDTISPGTTDTARIPDVNEAGGFFNPTANNTETIAGLTVEAGGELSITLDAGTNRVFTINGAMSNTGIINFLPDGAAERLDCSGDWTNNGTFNHSSGRVYFKGTTTFTGSTSFMTVRLTGTSVTLAAGSLFDVYNTAAGSFTINAGATFFNGTGTLQTKTFTNNGTYNRGTGTLRLLNNMNIPTTGIADGFYNLEIGNAGGGYTITITGNLLVYGALIINSGNTLNNTTLNITMQGVTNDGADWTNNGSYSATGGTVFFYSGSASAHQISGTTNFRAVTFGNGAATGATTLADGASVAINGACTVAASYTLNGSPGAGQYATLTFNPTATLTVTGTFTPQNGTVEWKPVTAIPGSTANMSYYNLTAGTAGTATVAGAVLNIANEFLINSGTTVNNSSNIPVNVGYKWTNNGTFTPGTSTVTFNAAGCIINSNQTFYNLTIGDGAGDSASIAMGKSITVSNTFTITASCTFNAGSSTTFTTGTLSMGGGAVFNEAYSTFVWNGAGLPDPDAAGTDYYNLTINAAATMSTAITVGNDLQINATKSLNTSGNTIYVGGNFINGNSYTNSGLTIFNGTGAQDISGAGTDTIANLKIDKTAGSVTLSKNLTVDTDFTIAEGTFELNSTTLTCNGTVNIGDGIGAADTGMFNIMGNCTLKVATSISVNSDGKLHTSGSIPTITSTNEIAPTRYAFTATGTVDINAVNLKYTDANGLNITVANGASSNIMALNGINFYNTAPAASYALKITVTSGILSATFNSHYYDATVADKNIYFFAPNGSVINMDAPTGAKSGETYTTDDDINYNVIWNMIFQWEGDDLVNPTDWHTNANWNIGIPPGDADSATIPNVANKPIISAADATVKNLTIESGSSLTINGTWTLNIYGTFTRTGTYNTGNGTTRFLGTGTQTIPPGGYNHIRISSAGTASPIGGTLVAANLTIDAGSIFNGVNYTLQLGGNWQNDGTFNPGTSTLELNGTSAQSLAPGSFYNITIANASASGVSFTGDTVIDGTLTINAGCKLYAGNFNHTVGVDWANSGTFYPEISSITLNGSAAQTLTNGNFYQLTISNSTGTVSIPGTGALTVSSNITVNSGATLDATNDTINVGGNWSSPGTFTSTGSTVVFNGTDAQSVNTETFNALQVNKTLETLTATGSIIANTLTVTQGTFNTGAGLSHTVTQSISVAGTFTLESGGILIVGSTGNIGSITVDASKTFNIKEDTILKMHGPPASTPSITINGTLNIYYTTIKSKIQSYDTVSGPFYSFTIGNTGTLYIEGLIFDSSNTAGMVINASAVILDIDEVNFQALQTGNVQALYINRTTGTYGFSACSFDSTCTINCKTVAGSVIVNFYDYGGSRSGATYESQAAGTAINWIANKNWTGAIDNLWGTANNWSPKNAPSNTNAVYIPTGKVNYPSVSQNGNAKMITIQDGASINMNYGAFTLTVSDEFVIDAGGTLLMDTFNTSNLSVGGSWTNNGTLTQNAAGGTISFTGVSKFIGSTSTFRKLTIGNGADYQLEDNASIAIISGGTFKVGNTAAATLRGGNNGTITTGTWTHFAGSTWVPGTSTVVWQGGALPNTLTTFYNLTIDSATAQLSAPIVVQNNLVINSGAALNASTFNITVQGNFANDGTFSYGAGSTLICDGTTIISGSGASELTLNNLTINLSKSFSLGMLVNNRLTVAGTLTNNGTLSLGSDTLQINGTFAGGGSSVFNYDTGTIYMNSTTAQTLPYTAFYNLQTASTATYRLTNDTTVYYNLTIGGNSIFDSSPNGGTNVYNLTIKNNWTQSGTGAFTERTSTVTFDSSSAQQITIASDALFYNLTISNPGTGSVTAISSFNTTNNISVTQGTLNLGTGLTFNQTGAAGSVSVSGGTLDLNQSSLSVTGNLSTSGTGKLDITDIACSISVTGNISNAGTIDATGSTINIACGGSWNDTGGFNIGQSTVTMSGAAKTITTPNNSDFYNLTVTGTVTAQNNIAIDNNLTINSGSLGLTGAYTHTIAGNIDNNATLSIGTSTVVLTGNLDNNTATSLSFTSGRLQIRGSFIPGSGVLNEGNGTIEFDNTTTSQSIPAETYYNLEIDKSANSATVSGNISVSNLLTVTTGTLYLDDGVTARTHTISGGISNSSTISFSAAATSVSAGGSFTNNGILTITAGTMQLTSGAGTFDNNGAININSSNSLLNLDGNLDITGGSISFNNAAGRLQVAGTFTVGTGTVSAAQGTIEFDGSTGASVPNTLTYYNIEIDKSTGTATASGGLTVSNEFRLTTGTFSAGVFSHAISGNWIETGGTFTAPAGSTITLNGSSPSITAMAGNSFKELTITISGTATCNSDFSATGNLSLTAGTLTLGTGHTHTIDGTITTSGGTTLNSGSSTVNCNGNITIGGTFNLQDGAVFKIANTKILTVNGAINSTYTTTKPKITSKTVNTERFTCTINGTIFLKGLTFESPDSNGLTIAAAATITDLDNVDFLSAPNPGTFLRVLPAAGTFFFHNNGFDDTFGLGAGANVYVPSGSLINLDMVDSIGLGQGENYDNDADNRCNWSRSLEWTAGAGTTSWNNINNWNPAAVPIAGDDVVIPIVGSGFYPVVDVATAYARALTLNNGASLTLGANNIEISSDLTLNGTFSVTTGTVKLMGTVAVSLTAPSVALYKLEINKTNSVTTLSNFDVTNDFTITQGTMNFSSYTINVGGNLTTAGTVTLDTGTVTVTGNVSNTGTINFNNSTGTLKIGGSFTAGTVSSANGTIEFNGNAAQAVPAVTYYHLKINKPAVTLPEQTATAAGALTINGDFNLLDGAFDPGASSHTVKGNWTESDGAVFQASAGTVTLNPAVSTAIDTVAGNSFYNLTLASGSATVGAGDALTSGGALDMTNGSLTLSNSASHSIGGNLTIGAGKTLDLTTGSLSVGGALANSGTIDLDQNSASLSVAGNFTNNIGATLSFSATSTATMGVGGNWTQNGTLATGYSTITFNGSGNSDITTSTSVNNFYNLAVNKSGAGYAKAINSLDINNNVTLTAGNFRGLGTAITLNVAGNWSVSTGTFTTAAVTIVFDGAGGQTVSGEDFNTVQITTAGAGITLLGNTTCGNLTINNSARLNLGSGLSHSVNGSLTNNGYLDAGTSTLSIASALDNSGAGAIVDMDQSAASLDCGSFTNQSSATLDFGTSGAANMTCNGDWGDSAVVTIGNSTVTINKLGATITTPNSNDFYNLIIIGTVSAANSLDINNNLTVNATSTFSLGSSSFSHDVAGNITVNGTLAIQSASLTMSGASKSFTSISGSAISMTDNSDLIFADNISAVINGTFTTTSTNNTVEPRITSTTPGTNRYNLTLGGPINIDGLKIASANTGGMTVASTASFTKFNGVDFSTVPANASSKLLYIKITSDSYIYSNNCSFDKSFSVNGTTSPGYNVQTDPGSFRITFDNYTGAGMGAVFHSQGAGSTIRWVEGNVWTGQGGNANWDNPVNWTEGVVPDSAGRAIIPNIATAEGGPYDPIINANVACNSITIQNGGILTLNNASWTVDTENDITIQAGGLFDMTANTTIFCGGRWTCAGTFNQTNGIVKLDGGQDGIGALSSGTFLTLQISGYITFDSTGIVTISGAGSSVTVFSGATLYMSSTAAIKLADASNFTLNSGGTFKTTNNPTITNTGGAARFNIDLNGTVDINGLNFSYGDAQGINISSTAILNSLQGIAFSNADAANNGNHLTVSQADRRLACPACTFDDSFTAGTGYNVSLADTNGGNNVRLFLSYDAFDTFGLGAGENYDNETNTAKVEWIAQSANATTDPGDYINDATTPTGIQGFIGVLIDYDTWTEIGYYALTRQAGNDVVKAYTNDGTEKSYSPLELDYATYPSLGDVVGAPYADTTGTGASRKYQLFFGTTGGYIVKVQDTLASLSATYYNIANCTEITSSVLVDGTNIYFAGLNTVPTTKYYMYAITYNGGTVTGFPVEIFAPSYSMPSYEEIDVGGSLKKYLHCATNFDAGTGRAYLFRFDIGAGAVRQEYTPSDANYPSADIVSPTSLGWYSDLYAGCNNGWLYGIDVTTANYANLPTFPYNNTSAIKSGVWYEFNDVVYYGDDSGAVHGIKVATGLQVFSKTFEAGVKIKTYPITLFYPVLPDAYIGNDNGKVYKFNIDDDTAPATLMADLGADVSIRSISYSITLDKLMVASSDGRFVFVDP